MSGDAGLSRCWLNPRQMARNAAVHCKASVYGFYRHTRITLDPSSGFDMDQCLTTTLGSLEHSLCCHQYDCSGEQQTLQDDTNIRQGVSENNTPSCRHCDFLKPSASASHSSCNHATVESEMQALAIHCREPLSRKFSHCCPSPWCYSQLAATRQPHGESNPPSLCTLTLARSAGSPFPLESTMGQYRPLESTMGQYRPLGSTMGQYRAHKKPRLTVDLALTVNHAELCTSSNQKPQHLQITIQSNGSTYWSFQSIHRHRHPRGIWICIKNLLNVGHAPCGKSSTQLFR